MSDAMLTELYRRVFITKKQAELETEPEGGDHLRLVALAKNRLLQELIDIRTEQIASGE